MLKMSAFSVDTSRQTRGKSRPIGLVAPFCCHSGQWPAFCATV